MDLEHISSLLEIKFKDNGKEMIIATESCYIRITNAIKVSSIKEKETVGENILIKMEISMKVNGGMIKSQVSDSIFLKIARFFQEFGVIIINFVVSIKFKVVKKHNFS